MVRGGRPADFPAAGLGDGQMLECNGNLEGVDVVVASCIYTSKGKESYASDQTFKLHVNNTLMISNNKALLCTKPMLQSTVANKIWLPIHPRNLGDDKNLSQTCMNVRLFKIADVNITSLLA